MLNFAFIVQTTGGLEQAAGKVMKVVSASPDTGQHGGVPEKVALRSPSTVGEGGEGDLC